MKIKRLLPLFLLAGMIISGCGSSTDTSKSTSQEASTSQTTSGEGTSQDTSSEGTSQDTSSEDTSKAGPSSEDTSQDTSSEDISGEDTSSEDISGEDTSSEDTSQGTSGGDTSGGDTSSGTVDPDIGNIDLYASVPTVQPKTYTEDEVRAFLAAVAETFEEDIPEEAVKVFRHIFNVTGLEEEQIAEFLEMYVGAYHLFGARDQQYESYDDFKSKTSEELKNMFEFVIKIGAGRIKVLLESIFSEEFMKTASNSASSRIYLFSNNFNQEKYQAYLSALAGTQQYNSFKNLEVIFDELQDPYGVTNITKHREGRDFLPIANFLVALSEAVVEHFVDSDYFLLATYVFNAYVPYEFKEAYQKELTDFASLVDADLRLAKVLKAVVLTEDSYRFLNEIARFKDLFDTMTLNGNLSFGIGRIVARDSGQFTFFDNIAKVANKLTNKEARAFHISIAILLEQVDLETVTKIVELSTKEEVLPSEVLQAVLPMLTKYFEKLKTIGVYDDFSSLLNKFNININDILESMQRAIEDFDAESDTLMQLYANAMAGLNIFDEATTPYHMYGSLTTNGACKVVGSSFTTEDINYLEIYANRYYGQTSYATIDSVEAPTDKAGRFVGKITYSCAELGIEKEEAYFNYAVLSSDTEINLLDVSRVVIKDSDYNYYYNGNVAIPYGTEPEDLKVYSQLQMVTITKANGVNSSSTEVDLSDYFKGKISKRAYTVDKIEYNGVAFPYRLAVYGKEDLEFGHVYVPKSLYFLHNSDISKEIIPIDEYYYIYGDTDLNFYQRTEVLAPALGITTDTLGRHRNTIDYQGGKLEISYYIYSSDQISSKVSVNYHSGPAFIYNPDVSTAYLNGNVRYTEYLNIQEGGMGEMIRLIETETFFNQEVDVSKKGEFFITVTLTDHTTGFQKQVEVEYYVVDYEDCYIDYADINSFDGSTIYVDSTLLFLFDSETINGDTECEIALYYFYKGYSVSYYGRYNYNLSELDDNYSEHGWHEGKQIEYQGYTIVLPKYYVYNKDELHQYKESPIDLHFSSNWIDIQYDDDTQYFVYDLTDYENCYLFYAMYYEIELEGYGQIGFSVTKMVSFEELGIPNEPGKYSNLSFVTDDGATISIRDGVILTLVENE